MNRSEKIDYEFYFLYWILDSKSLIRSFYTHVDRNWVYIKWNVWLIIRWN